MALAYHDTDYLRFFFSLHLFFRVQTRIRGIYLVLELWRDLHLTVIVFPWV